MNSYTVMAERINSMNGFTQGSALVAALTATVLIVAASDALQTYHARTLAHIKAAPSRAVQAALGRLRKDDGYQGRHRI